MVKRKKSWSTIRRVIGFVFGRNKSSAAGPDNVSVLYTAEMVHERCREARQDERHRIAVVLRGPHVGSDTCAWQATVRPIFDELADAIEHHKGEFK